MNIKRKHNTLKNEINTLLDHLTKMSPFSEEYTETANNLKTLLELQDKSKKKGVSLDTVVTVVGSLLGIVVIVWNEETRVITSKALGFVLKGRV